MSNELLWFIFAIANFSLMVLVYKLFGKTGLFVWVAIGTILANIQVTKSIKLFGMDATLGNIMYGTMFLATDCLGEKYSKKDGDRAVIFGFVAMIASLIVMQLALAFDPSDSDVSQGSLETIFGFLPRIALGSLTAYLVSQFLDVFLFAKIKEKLPSDKLLFVRNNLSTLISQFIDTCIFVPIAFLGVYDTNVFWGIFVSTYLIKALVALLDTPFLYLMKKINPLNLLDDKTSPH